MKELMDFFENYEDVVYITELATNKVIYLNKAARDSLHLTSKSQYLGHKCYKTFYGYDLPCANCTNNILTKNEFVKWSVINERQGSTFLLHDTIIEEEGIAYRVEIATDLNRQKTDTPVMKTNNNERILNKVFDTAYDEKDPEEAIRLTVECLGKQFDSDRMYIFEEKEDGTYSNTYEWCRSGVNPEIDHLQNVSASTFQIWNCHFEKNENIIIYDLEDYQAIDPKMYDVLKPQHIHSLVVGPLTIGNRRIGCYGVDNPPHEAINNITTMYTLLGKFLASLLRDRDRAAQLKQLSYHDALTNLYNRTRLEEYLETLDPNRSVTYFFFDINGLKTVNDHLGHTQGDLLIVHAATILKENFNAHPVFRMGGDEFLGICQGFSQDEAEYFKQQLIENLKKANVSLAIGMVWKPHHHLSFNEIFKEADAEMYKDKRNYYSNHQHDRRKQSA